MLKRTLILLLAMAMLTGWRCEDDMPTVNLRPDTDTTPDGAPLNFFAVPGPAFFSMLNDTSDSTYAWCIGTFPPGRAGVSTSFDDLPADAAQVTSLTLRLREGLLFNLSGTTNFSALLRMPTFVTIHRLDYSIVGTQAFADRDIVIPGGPWSKAEVDSMWWIVTVNGVIIQPDIDYRLSEVTLIADYVTAENIAHKICIPGGFNTEVALAGSIPECD